MCKLCVCVCVCWGGGEGTERLAADCCADESHVHVGVLIIIVVIIAFKGAIRYFLQSPHSAANCLKRTLKWPGRSCVQITCNTSSACRVQVSCYVPLGTKGQLSY